MVMSQVIMQYESKIENSIYTMFYEMDKTKMASSLW